MYVMLECSAWKLYYLTAFFKNNGQICPLLMLVSRFAFVLLIHYSQLTMTLIAYKLTAILEVV